MINIKNAVLQATQQLENHSFSARLDAEILLAHLLMHTRSYLYTHPDLELSQIQWQSYQQLVNKRRQGLPVAYITGVREFWSLPLKVSEDTLIPRPETELLVELTLALLADKPAAKILDLGTGSGAIALALAHEKPNWQIKACDICNEALKVAEENAARFNLKNICFLCSNWFENINNDFFDAIVANPPYIQQQDPHLNQGDLRFEPIGALVSGEDGLNAIRHIIKHSLARLVPDGLLLIEHGYEQKLQIQSMLRDYGYEEIQSWQDWQGNDRVSGARKRTS